MPLAAPQWVAWLLGVSAGVVARYHSLWTDFRKADVAVATLISPGRRQRR
ncbi:MAG: hypothetical protein M5U12_21085 [Verrucomicrobia bacterium]|nr:hypothetical protein [Verrucomicrobiota bacterium]